MQERFYISTRNIDNKVSAAQGILQGIARDGGLFVPEFIDELHFDLNELKDLDYKELTKAILAAFLPGFSPERIDRAVESAYTGTFDTNTVVSLEEGSDSYFLELWHGPTAAFKDLALTLLPHLMRESADIEGDDKKIVILTATSGDTGKAALEGFKDVENTEIFTFYPKDGVSTTQELQMLTTEGNNTHVIGVEGNFDDTQTAVKEIFNDPEFLKELEKNNYRFSSANSINLGRLIPQIVYYFYSYFELVKRGVIDLGQKVNFVVPTGNFGDILAGYYAYLCGLPIASLVCASNKNKILTDFFTTGVYDTNRDFYKTISPSMDILISSNLERLLFDQLDVDLKTLMDDLKQNGRFEVDKDQLEKFLAGYADEDEVRNQIKEEYEKSGYLLDPHTAVGQTVREKLKDKLDGPCIVLSTASPYKFSEAVASSLFGPLEDTDSQAFLFEKTGIKIPETLKDLEKKQIRHHRVSSKEDIKDSIKDVLFDE